MENDPTTADRLDALIREVASEPPEQALVALTNAANRAIIELHKLARQEASARRGQPDWGKWARVANAARSGVLQIAAVRDSIKAMGTGKATGADKAMDTGNQSTEK